VGTEREDYLDRVLIGGREPVQITVMDYHPTWPAHFQDLAAVVRRALGPRAGLVEHIGSTALRVREAEHRMLRTPGRDVHLHVYEPDRPEVRDYLDLRTGCGSTRTTGPATPAPSGGSRSGSGPT